MQHTHTLHGDDWPQIPPVSWAPGADPTLPDRAAGACHAQCQSCMADLAMEAAANSHSITVLLNIAMWTLVLPERVPGCTWLEGLLRPHPPLPTILGRIKDREMQSPAVIGMMEEFSAEDRLGIAAAALNLMEQFFKAAHRTAFHIETHSD